MVFNYNCIIYTLTVLVTSYYQTSKISETFSAKISTQKNFWELGSQDPILFPPLPVIQNVKTPAIACQTSTELVGTEYVVDSDW